MWTAKTPLLSIPARAISYLTQRRDQVSLPMRTHTADVLHTITDELFQRFIPTSVAAFPEAPMIKAEGTRACESIVLVDEFPRFPDIIDPHDIRVIEGEKRFASFPLRIRRQHTKGATAKRSIR